MATFETLFQLSDSITVQVSGLDTSFKNNRDFDFYIDGKLDGSVNNVSPTNSSVSYTYENLKPETSYDLKVIILFAGTDTQMATFTLSDVHTLEEEEPEPDVEPPDKWSWVSSNGDATSTQTQNAYTAFTENGECSDVSYKVWNDMCAKVLEVLDYNENEWHDSYLSFSNTKMSSSDKVLTAKRFNSLSFNASNATGGLYAFTPREKGQPVKGSYFTDLMNTINGYIDYINSFD